MDVRVDKARKGEPPLERPLASAGRDATGDLDNAPVGDADVDRGIVPGDPSVAQHEVERHGGSLTTAILLVVKAASVRGE